MVSACRSICARKSMCIAPAVGACVATLRGALAVGIMQKGMQSCTYDIYIYFMRFSLIDR